MHGAKSPGVRTHELIIHGNTMGKTIKTDSLISVRKNGTRNFRFNTEMLNPIKQPRIDWLYPEPKLLREALPNVMRLDVEYDIDREDKFYDLV